MKAMGLLFFMWAIGYFVAMNITVKGLPTAPLFLLIAIGIILCSVGENRNSNKRK